MAADTANLGDLWAFDPAGGANGRVAWEDLSKPATGSPPSGRIGLGLVGGPDRLYLYGGVGSGGVLVVPRAFVLARHLHQEQMEL